MLAARAISKQFGSVTALSDVTVEFAPGEIHAVLGENGAGKSTLMNVVAGFQRPDEGEVLLDGRSLHLGDPREARAAGIEFVHQHFTLVPEFTVEENLALALGEALLRTTVLPAVRRRGIEAAQELGWTIDPSAKVRDLSVGEMQRVEIVKCLLGKSRVLILDEPTAVLSPEEAIELFAVLKRLASQGKVVVLIAHKLSEVLAVADRITVLREGRVVATSVREGLTEARLAEWMVGELPPLDSSFPKGRGAIAARIDALSVAGDRGEIAVRGVSFEIEEGEIVGIGGVDGNGQIELAEALVGLREPKAGKIDLHKQSLTSQLGDVAFIPQDRQREGLALEMSIEENLLIDGHVRPEFNQRGWLNRKRIREWCNRLLRQFDIRAKSGRQVVGELSGGNQQKVVVSRALDRPRKLLVAVNPTRGLDVAATRFVRQQIREAAGAGAAVALVTTDFDELAELSSRAFLMSRGQLSQQYSAEAALGGTD